MPNVEAIVDGLNSLLGRESVSDDYLRLRIDVLRAQAAVLAELEGATFSTGNRLPLEPESIPFDAALARWLFDGVARACRRHGNPGPELAELQSGVAGKPELLERLIREATSEPVEERVESVRGPLRAPTELLVFAGRLLAAPFVTSAAREVCRLGGVRPESSGSCPVCGSRPGLASLRPDDAARVLHCSLCATDWRFTRLDCPFCAPPDQGSLVRLKVAGEEARWIEACDRCKHYLKVVDRRQPGRCPGGEFTPLIEDAAGLCLDLVAEKQGYLHGPVYAALR
jgi:FdhE protein